MRKLFTLKKISSLKALLLYWIVGSALAFVLFYNALLEVQFRFGLEQRTQLTLDWHAQEFEKLYVNNPNSSLPKGFNIQSYLGKGNIPKAIEDIMINNEIEHKEIELFTGEDTLIYDEEVLLSTLPICEQQICEAIFFYSYQLSDDNWLFILQGIEVSDEIEQMMDIVDALIWGVTFIVLVIISGLASFLVRKITHPVKELADWAENLQVDALSTQRPDFKYQELNQVANQLVQAFMRLRESVEKEHQFLQQVSHELRTPLATASGNLEILNLLDKTKAFLPQEKKAIKRLNYSISDMRQITETLLWLNRDHESLPEPTAINLQKIVKEIVETNRYLLEGKRVNVDIGGESLIFEGYEVLTGIILANLIRNAFQYTYEGDVCIEISENFVKVENINCKTNEFEDDNDDEYGFGLGLHLVTQIADRMKWHYHHKPVPQGWYASVTFLENKLPIN